MNDPIIAMIIAMIPLKSLGKMRFLGVNITVTHR